MPYIKNDRRTALAVEAPVTAGELNYQITMLCLTYMGGRENVSYTLLNEIVGALECAKLELYRRVLSLYEDMKMQEIGRAHV